MSSRASPRRLYPPPVAFLYHFLSPSNFFAFLICGSLFVVQVRLPPLLPLLKSDSLTPLILPSQNIQTFLLVHLYTHLVSDRATLSSEVLHEYNAKFVNPRIFVQKRDACVSTSEAEFVQPEDYRLYGHGQGRRGEVAAAGEEEEEVVRRGSGRRVRRRESALPLEEPPADSPVPRRKKGSLLVQ